MLDQLAVREITRSIDRFRALQPSHELREFVATIPVQADKTPERRGSPRFQLVVDVTVLPLDDTFHPISAPFVACCRNLSSGGICFYHQNPAPSEFLFVEIDSSDLPSMQAVMKVLRQTRVGQFWEIAGEFLHDVDIPDQVD